MSRFLLDLARPEDDAALRRVLAAAPMEGGISLSFRREPDFFAGEAVDGFFRQVIVGRDCAEGEAIVGLGSRSIRRVYVDGAPAAIGYLSLLRVLPQYRGRGRLLANAYRYFHTLHADGRTPLYLTTIAEKNASALAALTSGRAGLPAYHFAGRFLTAAIPIAQRRRAAGASGGGVGIRAATNGDLDDLLLFLRRNGPERQFFPIYDRGDFQGSEGALRGLRLDDVLIARRGEAIVGTLAAWDQQSFRQTVVAGYSRAIRLARPFVNRWASLRGLPRLPSPGASLRCLAGAIPVVAAGERDPAAIFAGLLDAMLAHASGGRAEYLTIGLHESDPLLESVRRRRTTWYATNLYHVCWEDGEAFRGGIGSRTPYLELGSL